MEDSAQSPLEQIETFYKSLPQNIPFAIALHKVVTDASGKPIDYIFLEVNKQFEEFTGLKRENVLNKRVTEAIPGTEKATPNLIKVYGQVALTGKATQLELYFEPLKRWYRAYAYSPQKDYFFVVFTDISKEKEDEKILNKNQQKLRTALRAVRTISECNQVIVHASDEYKLLQRVCEEIIKTTGYKFAWVGYAGNNQEKTVKPVANAGFEEGYLESIKVTWGDDEYGQGPTGLSIKTRKPAIMQNIATNPSYAPWREHALKRGYQSSACFPFQFDNTVGTLCIYAPEPDTFGEEEVKLFEELAEDIAYGISGIRGRKEKSKIANQLQIILDSVSDGIFTLDHDFRYTYINDQGAIMVGRKSAADLQGKILWDEFPEARGSAYDNLYHDAMDNKKVLHFEEYYAPLKKWHEGTIYPNPDGITIFFQEITNRKLNEEKLKKEEQELKESQRIGHVGSWDWNATTDKITWSDEYYRIIGLELGSPPPGYQDHLKQYAPESSKRLDEAVQKAMKDGTPYELDLEQIRPNGARGWIIARGEVIRDKDNKIVGLRGTAQDITERKIAEEKIRKANAYNRNLIEVSLDPMLTIDEGGKITDVNKAFEVATGVERIKLIGTDVFTYFTDPEKVREGLEKTLREGFIRDYRVAIKNISNNSILDCVWNTVVFKDEKGIIQGIFAAARDISQLKKTEKALQLSEQKYKAYIDNTYDIIYSLDSNGVLNYLSSRAKDYGVDPELIVGQKFEKFIIDEDRGITLRTFQEGLQKHLRQIRATFRYKNPDGRLFWFEAIGSIQYDQSGIPISNIGVMRDITERKISEDRLRELDTIKSRFIRVVSHQMRTPLSAIRWQLESLLSEHDHLTELQKQLVQESYRANLEIINSINDLITALDIEEGVAVHLDKMPNSLLSLWESVAVEFAITCKVKNIILETIKPTSDIPLIDMDTERIRTVMQKIVDNALMYTKEDGKITVKIEKMDSIIRFIATDTGVGIPKDEQKYIFERFYRASNASLMKPDASGLGLYIAKNFIESHGGKMGFTSEEGKGSTFWFEIPLS